MASTPYDLVRAVPEWRPGEEITTSFIETAGEDPRSRLDEAR